MFSANSSQVSEDRLYVEDVFSTYLYTGNGSTQTITNGIDLAGKGGMVWIKNRAVAQNHFIQSTQTSGVLSSNTTSALSTPADFVANSNGFTSSWGTTNGNTYASWTFRKAPKFFDVVTYTGDGINNRSISHNLGIEPGFIIVKATSTNHGWACFHRGNGTNQYALRLNSTGAGYTPATAVSGFPVSATSTTFTVRSGVNGWDAVDYSANDTGQTYVAYLFAHDTTSDGIIQCGSYTGNGSATGPTVTLGWEPQWLLVKDATSAWDWRIVDNMRGMPVGSGAASLFPNLSNAEFTTSTVAFSPTATGFQVAGSAAQINTSGNTYIYIAIRRGPMRTPTSGTSVFMPVTATNPSSPYTVTTNFPVDLSINTMRNLNGVLRHFMDRLRGGTTTTYTFLNSASTAAEVSGSGSGIGFQNNTAIIDNGWMSGAGFDPIYYNFRRAPSFFDEVCYTGTGVARTINHNLGVAPELMIVKNRSAGGSGYWITYAASQGAGKYLALNATDAVATYNTPGFWNNTSPTTSVFSVSGGDGEVNNSGTTYVAYLFASCPGVSKVGSYTGNGSSQTINCGFAAGARFVMIKRTDSTGDWYVWDTARGIVAANDPHLSLNTTAAEVTTDDSIDPDNSGFIVNQVAATNINVSSATYIYLAVA